MSIGANDDNAKFLVLKKDRMLYGDSISGYSEVAVKRDTASLPHYSPSAAVDLRNVFKYSKMNGTSPYVYEYDTSKAGPGQSWFMFYSLIPANACITVLLF